jgi:16S rRNA (cytosine967-C5)-methyltransferase
MSLAPTDSPADKPAPNARRVALDLLRAVLRGRTPLDEALGAEHRLGLLATRDRAFARRLVATCLRRLGTLDALIGRCLDRPLKPQFSIVQDLLRLGACQLLILGTPPHAALAETLRLAEKGKQAGFKKLITAVLRRLDREGAGWLAELDAERLDTPDWLWESWAAAYGAETARAIARAHAGEPPLDLTLADPTQAGAWAEALGAAVLPTGSLRLPPGRGEVARLPGYEQGAWWVQDAAAALPARLLGPVAGRRTLDLCAAPGGKTAQLAAAGANVVAVDADTDRLGRLVENLNRLKLGAPTVAADAATWQPPRPAEAVLLDAPCSATGTLRRHPDIARLKRGEDLDAIVAVQKRLLANAIACAAPGAPVVYAVCSLQPEEGPGVVEAALAEGAPAVRERIDPLEIGGLAELLDADGALRTLPCHLAETGGLDGFYAVRLRRT